MALPDPHAGELTVEIDRDKYQLWQDAIAAAKAWMEEANRLRDELEATMGDAYAATVDGRKVITYRPKDQYAVTRLKADYPQLVEHFTRHKVEPFVDMVSFAASHPDIAEKYRVRAFRSVD